MKKYLIALALTAVMTTATATATQQLHRHTPRTAVADTRNNDEAGGNDDKQNAGDEAKDKAGAKAGTVAKSKTDTRHGTKGKKGVQVASAATSNDDGGIEAYSDTTSAALDSTGSQWQNYSYQMDMDEESLNNMMNGLSWISSGIMGTVLILLILFVIAPVSILLVLLYFIYKTRKQKLKLAEMAIKNGQPVPDVLGMGTRATPQPADDALWRQGIKHVFIGIGLMFLFGFMNFSTGIGIGFLVFFYGAGQAVIARTSQKRTHDNAPNDTTTNSDDDDTAWK